MREIIKLIVIRYQKTALFVSYFMFQYFVKKKNGLWVIGVDDVGGVIFRAGEILKPSVTVCFNFNEIFNFYYTYSYSSHKNIFARIKLFLYTPILLGYLISKSDYFFYNWHTGFLIDRDTEFSFLKERGKKIVCRFAGDDIRSLKKSIEYADLNNIDISSRYYGEINSFFLTDSYEREKKNIAIIANKYADLIFSYTVDQVSYLEGRYFPWFHYVEESIFNKDTNKYSDVNNKEIIVVHAPSSPIIKGTQLVRSAVKKLEVEGYQFKYIELIDKSNSEVLEILKHAHIVLNQFYLFIPGVFGIEAMANYCAVLMSADSDVEEMLPQEKDAWLITKYWQVYDNLKYLLDNPVEIENYATKGYDYAMKYHSKSSVERYLNDVFIESDFYKDA